MRSPGRRFVRVSIVAILFGSLPLAYWLGYRAGYQAQQPDRWALVTVRRNPSGSVSGQSYDWYDRGKPEDERRLYIEEARLRSINADFYLAKARMEISISAEPDPRRASAHR